MDIRKAFATDRTAEQEGVWVALGDGARVKVARFNNPRHRSVLDRLRRPYRSLLMAGRDLPEDVAEAMAVEATAEALLLDWDGITENGQPLAYGRETARRLLAELPDFRDAVAYLAMQAETFRREALETAEKN
ncbi:MAG: hypothetical protein EAZ99_16580 [Alphaproteobacteria bacterium]|nr:MAG: hypothetical protein EAZ99_16580 [Alphaproteobacteria bacterium]